MNRRNLRARLESGASRQRRPGNGPDAARKRELAVELAPGKLAVPDRPREVLLRFREGKDLDARDRPGRIDQDHQGFGLRADDVGFEVRGPDVAAVAPPHVGGDERAGETVGAGELLDLLL